MDAELPAWGDKQVIGYVHSLTWRTLKTPGTTKQHHKQTTPTIISTVWHFLPLVALGVIPWAVQGFWWFHHVLSRVSGVSGVSEPTSHI